MTKEGTGHTQTNKKPAIAACTLSIAPVVPTSLPLPAQPAITASAPTVVASVPRKASPTPAAPPAYREVFDGAFDDDDDDEAYGSTPPQKKAVGCRIAMTSANPAVAYVRVRKI